MHISYIHLRNVKGKMIIMHDQETFSWGFDFKIKR